MTDSNKQVSPIENITEKLKALYTLQSIDNEIFKIETLRGELPLEVQDLEDEIEGLETRANNIRAELKESEDEIKLKQNDIINSKNQIKKYQDQQMNVRNNREFESLAKEIEYQELEIEYSEKIIREHTEYELRHRENLEITENSIQEKQGDLEHKRAELNTIIAETQVEEDRLNDMRQKTEKQIEDRLLNAYKRIKKNARNKLAVVVFDRESCGGCFNAIPPQRMVDIRHHKKIIDCEYCGRILIDPDTANEVKSSME